MPKHGKTKPIEGTPVRFYPELRRLAKQANQRMVRLEKAKMKTGAYEAIQANLEMMGRRSPRAKGRRFSETGKATYNEMEHMVKILKRFLKAETSTVAGEKRYRTRVFETANKLYDLEKYKISEDDYYAIWKAMPSKMKDRIFGSEIVIEIVETYLNKNGEKSRENLMSIEDLVSEINSASDIKEAYKKLGLKISDNKGIAKGWNLND